MPKLTREIREVVVSTAARADRVNRAAVAFHDQVRAGLSVPGAVELGLAWQESTGELPPPGFVIISFSGNVIADFDHVANGADLMGRFRFYRHVGDAIQPKLAEFWSILIDEHGSATWSVPGIVEWSTTSESDVREFLYRLLAELYDKIDRV